VAGETEGTRKTVLIVDDEPEIRRVIAVALSSHGYKTIESPSGSEALSRLQQAGLEHGIDIVITDIAMPDMDGVTLAERLAERFPQTRVVLMSGFAEVPLSRIENLRSRWAFVAKPFSLRKLMEAVRGAPSEDGDIRAA
jgi:two-component system cell cycle sensor histidine kinase/response regulator CckA